MDIFLILCGLGLLVIGGDALVRGAVSIAARIGVSPLIIGLTLVGFGTSLPELLTSLDAAARGADGIALGAVLGSNIANILLILGLAAIIRPVMAERQMLMRDGLVMALSAIALSKMLAAGGVGQGAALGLLLGLTAYLAWTCRSAGQTAPALPGPAMPEGTAAGTATVLPLTVPVAMALAGIAATILGARLLVDGAVGLARALAVSEAVIGLTVVALGTSLPELVTAVIAARKGESDIAIGNVVGSNIFNVLGILGVTGLVFPLAAEGIARIDTLVMLAATAVFGIVALTSGRISRSAGALLLAGYAGYIAWVAATA